MKTMKTLIAVSAVLAFASIGFAKSGETTAGSGKPPAGSEKPKPDKPASEHNPSKPTTK